MKIAFLILCHKNPNQINKMINTLDDEDVSFIKKHAFNDRSDDERFMRCFFHDVIQESEKMFELRMMFYEHYPDYAKEEYIDVKSLIKKFDKRILRLISFWVKNKIKSQGECVYRYEEELVDINNSFLINNGELVLNELIQYIPKEIGLEVKYSAWSGMYFHKSIERVCVELVKKATIALIGESPDNFWNYYETYMGKGYHVFNEIILTGLIHMPPRYSNRIIHYLATDLNKNIFDYTSGAEDELGLAEEILKIHGKTCNEEELLLIENIIYKYISPDAVELYKRRIERNRSKEYPPVYWSFWGDLQYKLLNCLPKERISKKTKELLNVLDRRFDKVRLCYSNLNNHSGFVRSPVAGKKISRAQWLQIITNRSLEDRNRSKWVEVEGGFTESSYEMYAIDFQSVVKQQPQEMIELVLENKQRVLPVFIDALFLGMEFSEILEKVDFTIIEKVFIEFPCDMKSCRASYFCRIIEKVSKTNWAREIIEQLIHIALKHRDPERDNTNVINQEDKKMKKQNKKQAKRNAMFRKLRKYVKEKYDKEIAKKEKKLGRTLEKKEKIKITILGNGSNILVADKGIQGIVIKTNLKEITIKNKKQNKVEITTDDAVPIGMLAQKLLKQEITGFEEISGIPGTIGGAILMNAGAHGKEMKDIITEITAIDYNGQLHTFTNEQAEFTYRNSIFSNGKYIILQAKMMLEKGNTKDIKAKMDEYAQYRKDKQPIEYPSAGSTFKRGTDFITAKLIDECGLKGYQIGGAQISEKHAGFIINKENATAKDVIKLMEYTKEQVYNKFGKIIEQEIEII